MISRAQNACPPGCPHSLAPEKSLFIVQKQHVSTGLSLPPKENVRAFFVAEKSIFLKTHTHTHTHTSPLLSLSLHHLKNQHLSRQFLIGHSCSPRRVKSSLSHTHMYRVTWRLTAGRTLCISTHLSPSLHTHMPHTFRQKRAPHPLRE